MKKDNGFTLIEMLITILVLAILATVGVSSYSNIIGNNRIISTTNSIMSGIQTARTEALSRGVPVIFCVNDGANTDCGGVALDNIDTAGWLVASDINTNGTVDGNDEVLRIAEAPAPSMQIIVANFGQNFIRYSALGLLEAGIAAADGSTNFTICDNTRTNELGRRLDLTLTGDARITPLDNLPANLCP